MRHAIAGPSAARDMGRELFAETVTRKDAADGLNKVLPIHASGYLFMGQLWFNIQSKQGVYCYICEYCGPTPTLKAADAQKSTAYHLTGPY